MTALGSVEGDEQRAPGVSDDLDEQAADDAPPAARKPREPLSARAVVTIAATVIAALIGVVGAASVAAFNTLRDDMTAGDASLRAEMREQFAETHAILRDHTERLARVETRQQDNTERLARLEDLQLR